MCATYRSGVCYQHLHSTILRSIPIITVISYSMWVEYSNKWYEISWWDTSRDKTNYTVSRKGNREGKVLEGNYKTRVTERVTTRTERVKKLRSPLREVSCKTRVDKWRCTLTHEQSKHSVHPSWTVRRYRTELARHVTSFLLFHWPDQPTCYFFLTRIGRVIARVVAMATRVVNSELSWEPSLSNTWPGNLHVIRGVWNIWAC